MRLVLSLAVAGVAVALCAAPAQATILGPRAGHSPNADDIRTAYWVALVVALVLIVVVHAFLIAALLRFRARRGRTARRLAAGPGAFLRPTVALAVVAVGLFVFGIVMTADTRQVQPTEQGGLGAKADLVAQVNGLSVPADARQLEIDVIGQRWLWRFEYPGGTPGNRVFSYNELVVPVDTTVILHVTSTDVTHRWFIPALDGQVDAVPGRSAETWFRADREGVYPGQSTSFSGTSYAAMRAWVEVVSPQQYQQFVERKKKELAAAQAFVQREVQEQAAPEALP